MVGDAAVNYINPSNLSDRHRIIFPNASFIDAKFKSGVNFVDDHNPSQVRDMIDVLSNMKGGYIDGKWDPNIKASDYGSASLTLITPANTIIDPKLIEYATSRNVAIYQRTTEQDEENGNRVRVAPNAVPLNLTPSTEGIPMLLKTPGQSVDVNWEKK